MLQKFLPYFKDAPSWLPERLILLGYKGSIAYGTNTEDSDLDFQGIVIPPEEYYLGLKRFEQYQTPEGSNVDIVIFSLEKFARLAMQNNPNVLELLWLNEDHYIVRNSLGSRLISIRDKFLSKAVYKTFGGYALAQLHKMQQRGGKPNHGKGGPDRQQDIERYGYCTKNAMHLIRLMKMGIEILSEGKVQVYRPDREYLLSVRQGKYTLDELIRKHDELYKKMTTAYERSDLPDSPDFDSINNVIVEITKVALGGGDWRRLWGISSS